MTTEVNASAPIAEGTDQVVTVLREQVLALCTESPRHPATVRVSAHGVAVEVEWPEPAAASVAEAEPASPDVAPAPVAEPAGTTSVCAETVGTFYRAPEPGAKPFVTEGDVIAAGTQIGIIEAMKLMIPVSSDRAGRVVEFRVSDGTPVEHGQPLLVLEPAP
ncbi:acetyl-CoA carboxylase biotin carboxyl carrier protein [Amycolatopsis orientalis]|uniref:acetyl-CoA carboxylase biotin carboxyl carrier protein n=1 Tax=Amycolatopsis orientalis TaxID=31958 RepID=UPI00039F7D7F|nr:biotin/lipoyl-containing protein [Amycolatopsis orientalis]